MDESRLCKMAFEVQLIEKLSWSKGVVARCADLGISPPHPMTEYQPSQASAFNCRDAIEADRAALETFIMTPKPNSRKENT